MKALCINGQGVKKIQVSGFCSRRLPLYLRPMSENSSPDRILYFYDALCGWCYGFSPVVLKLYEKYSPDMPVITFSGGMIKGDRIGPIGETAGYIKTAYKKVEEFTGVTFGEGFLQGVLEKGTDVFTSVPPAQLMSAFRRIDATQTVLFAHALQKAIYFDGIPPQDLDALAAYGEDLGVSKEQLKAGLQDPQTEAATQQDFKLTNDLKVSGFPTLFVEHNGHLYRVSTGYRPFKDVDEMIGRVLKIKH